VKKNRRKKSSGKKEHESHRPVTLREGGTPIQGESFEGKSENKRELEFCLRSTKGEEKNPRPKMAQQRIFQVCPSRWQTVLKKPGRKEGCWWGIREVLILKE